MVSSLPHQSATVPDPPPRPYRGRFAPSPRGPLHFGSLVAAVGSFAQARSRGGEWLLRIDDLDTPRVVPGAVDAILRALDAFGLHWDGKPVFQNQQRERYRQAMDRLRHNGAVYPCACCRRDLLTRADGSRYYPGHCRNGIADDRQPRSERVRCEGVTIAFDDPIQGHVEQQLEQAAGDFIVVRAGGLHAYHLAVVVDDAVAGITEVVRGADLLSSTPAQIHLQRLLGLPTPAYRHLPLAHHADGDKLSKQTGATALDPTSPVPALWQALTFLGQAPPAGLQRAALSTLWQWTLEHWQPARIPAAVDESVVDELTPQ